MLALLLVAAPAVLVVPLGNALLATQDIRIIRLDSLRLRPQQTLATSVHLEVPGMRLEIDNLTLTYRLGELVGGRLRALSADEIRIEPRARDAAPMEGSALTAEQVLAGLTDLPFERAAVGRINYGPLRLQASLSMETAPLRLSSQLRPEYQRDWRADLSLRVATANSLIGSSVLLHEGDELFGADFDVTVQEDSLSLEVESGFDVALLAALPDVAAILGDVELLSESLHLSGQLRMTDLSNSPRIESLVGVLDSPDSLLQWQLDTGDGHSGQVHLPLEFELESAQGMDDLIARVDSARLRLRQQRGALQFDAEASLSALTLRCARLPVCSGALQFSLLADSWRTSALSGGSARLAGNIAVDFDPPTIALRAPDLDLTLADIEHGAGTATVAFSLDGLEADLGEGLALRLEPVSTTLVPGIDGLSLTDPILRGSLDLTDSTVNGNLTLSLGERLHADLVLQHALDSSSGSLDLTLRPTRFSDDSPSSQLASFAGLPVDLVAGELSGEAALRWQAQGGDWRVDGPLTLRLDQLSGIVGDGLFVGLDTLLRARLDEEGLHSDGLLEAGVATADIGLPLERIDWRYAFDSAARTLTISDLGTAVLGGSVEVPRFVYDANRERNRLELVLSELDLQSIVALANYPNLQVQGRISGYLPILFTPEGVLIEEGLIGALNPGGSIRYTPTNPTSDNPSVQLLNDALSNYLYQVFDAQVEYGPDGELAMAVALRGVNPDMNGGQPINLNVTITDNIPSLLQSLQASRVISERLEELLNRQ
ncbi:MAG: YdbH domain-containing protein [Pseudohongiellaceae bacterium]